MSLLELLVAYVSKHKLNFVRLLLPVHCFWTKYNQESNMHTQEFDNFYISISFVSESKIPISNEKLT